MKARQWMVLSAALTFALMLGCTANAPPADDNNQPPADNNNAPPADNNGDPGNNPPTTGGNTSDSTTLNARNYEGHLDGSVADVSSTDASLDTSSARLANAQELPAGASAWITDLQGHRLQDAAGSEYPNFSINSDGTFDLAGLPVGVDLVLNIDVDGDGNADLVTIVNIPVDAGGDGGQLDHVRVDPLSTLSYSKLVALLQEAGVDPAKLNLSFSALIERIRDAFENLSSDSGIDLNISLDNILSLPPDQLAALFDQLIPEGAQRGMQMFRGNIALAVASDAEAVVKAVAAILLQGGFAIADAPGGVDLSFLANEPNIRTTTFSQYRQEQNPTGGAAAKEPPPPQGFVEPTLYISTVAEPDRNFVNNDDGGKSPPQQVFMEEALTRMAEAYLAGKTITLDQLYRLLVDANTGLGARLTYGRFMGPNMPPIQVFESTDGGGIERDSQQLFNQINALGLNVPDPQTFAARQAQLRQLLIAFLAGTAEPSFDRLFGGFLMDRVPSADEVARVLRERRAHLPFSRSGPDQLYVIANADSMQDPSAQAVRVAVDVDAQGVVQKVRVDAAGKFYVAFGPPSDQGMQVGLINAGNGRMLHDHKGSPQFFEISDSSIFENVGDRSFLDAFSARGHNYPGSPVLTVPNMGFDPNRPEDPQTNPRNFQVFVLMTQPGPDGVPVRVDYANGSVTFNPNVGQYYVAFDPETINGKFALTKQTGEMLSDPPGDYNTRVLITPADIQGLPPMQTDFLHVFGINLPNPAYDPTGAPYYDDVNGNSVEDSGEPTFSQRYFLNNPDDWRSTFVEQYYRKASDNGFPHSQNVDWSSQTPRLHDGDPLVPRNFRPRFNAFFFGRPNVAVNLLMAFSPPDFFDGTHALNADTPLNPFTVLALVDLVFDSVQNVEAYVDFDGPGPTPQHLELIDARFFVPPVGDPVQLLLKGFGDLVKP